MIDSGDADTFHMLSSRDYEIQLVPVFGFRMHACNPMTLPERGEYIGVAHVMECARLQMKFTVFIGFSDSAVAKTYGPCFLIGAISSD